MALFDSEEKRVGHLGQFDRHTLQVQKWSVSNSTKGIPPPRAATNKAQRTTFKKLPFLCPFMPVGLIDKCMQTLVTVSSTGLCAFTRRGLA